MRRLAISLTALALLAAACGGGGGETAEPAPLAAGEGVALAYGYSSQPGADYRFGVTLDMVVNMDGGAALGAPDGPMKMGLDAAGDLSYSFTPGEQEGTTEITLGVGFDTLDIREMSVDGQSMADMIPPGEEGSVFDADGLIPEMTVVVDDHGKVLSLSYGDQALPAELFGGGDLMSGSPVPGGVGPEMLLGPQFPADKLAVGSTWSVDDSRDVGFGDPVETRTDYVVAGQEQVAGRTLWVVESTTTMEPIDVDFAELMDAMAGEEDMAGMGGDELAEAFGSMFEEMDMRFVITAQPTTATTWFDAAAGQFVKTFGEGSLHMQMEMAMFGETAKINMNMDMSMVLELQDTPTAAADPDEGDGDGDGGAADAEPEPATG